MPETMRRMDQAASEVYAIPGMVLMENAASRVAMAVAAMPASSSGVILLLAGPGNNGGDAFAAARHLLIRGCSVRVAAIVPVPQYRGDAAANLDILLRMGVPVAELSDPVTESGWEALFRGCSIVVDGLFGTGLSRSPEGLAREAILQINRFQGPVLSIDIPSGVDGRTGQVHGIAVRADETVTFALGKPGLYLHPGASCAGRVIVADIGMPAALMDFSEPRLESTDTALVAAWLPKRADHAHKGSVGTVLSVAGSHGMTGAAVLAASAVLRGGAGLVRCALPEPLVPILSTLVPEAVVLPVPGKGGRWTATDADDAGEMLPGATALLVGPGLPVDGETDLLLDRLLQAAGDIPVVLDAGALGLLAAGEDIAGRLPAQVALTPHPGEMSRMMRISTAEVLKDPLGNALRCALEWNAVIVLKGAGTVIASPDGRAFVNTTGNSGMATAGSGDVLAGLIASLAAQGMELVGAAVCGVFLHGLAGDLAARAHGRQALVASDLVSNIGAAYLEIAAMTAHERENDKREVDKQELAMRSFRDGMEDRGGALK
jgi:hydroxyethylthiazole kinase-like uncharacterized protein yjeF